MPNFMRHVNKHVFNRWELARGNRPVLVHKGRVSQTEHRTPLEPRPIDDGYAFILMYGADRTDWVQNVLAAGEASLIVGPVEHRLTNPRVVEGEEGWSGVPKNDERPPALLKITEMLRMDLA